MDADCGHEPTSGLYWERLGDPGAVRHWLFIHGGGATGACFRRTPDGRPGWAQRLADRGDCCWVTDWPATGRSGGQDILRVRYDDLVAGYVALLRDVIARPVVILCHSMGGAITWPVCERTRELVTGVVAFAASHPGNLAGAAADAADDGVAVRVRFAASGVEFVVRRDRAEHYSDAYVRDQAIATSARFPARLEAAFRASLVPLPPLVLLQRLGLEGGLPRIGDAARLAGLPVLVIAGPEDPAHTREIEAATAAGLRAMGARASLAMLEDLRIDGNGHFAFAETNSDEVLDAVVGQAALAGL